ncbi:MAG: hypothetical protein ACJ76L_07330 [Conexibacter sp.]
MPDDSRARRRRRRVTLAIALALLVVALAATLSRAHDSRTGTNGIPAEFGLTVSSGPHTICQAGEQIPAGTAAIRVALIGSGPAPSVVVTDGEGRSVIGPGAHARPERKAVLVPLARPLRDDAEGDVCVKLPGSGRYALLGIATVPDFAATEGTAALGGRVHLEYLAAGTRSWWSSMPTLVRRLGRGHAWSGPSVALLAALLMFAPIALAAWQLTRDEGR